MHDELVPIYEASDLGKAKLASDQLSEQGIANYLEDVGSPLNGPRASEQTLRVMVAPADVERARTLLGDLLGDDPGASERQE